MRLAIVGDAVLETPHPTGHGLGRMVSQLAEWLFARGHDVTLFARPGSHFSGVLVTPEDAVSHGGYEGELALAREVMRAHRADAFDAVLDNSHIHRLSDLFPSQCVVNVYHDNFQPYQRCAVILSEGQRALLPAAFETARCIPNALNPADFTPGFTPQQPPYAFFCGALSDIKQPLLAIEACARMGIKLIMAGGALVGHIPFTHANHVEYIGAVTADIRNRLMANATVFLQLGTVESFGLTTLEAQLCGCPVVAWPAGGSLDLVQYGVNGVFVPVQGSDTVGNVVDAMTRAADIDRQIVRGYTERRMWTVEQQLDGYEQALADCVRGMVW